MCNTWMSRVVVGLFIIQLVFTLSSSDGDVCTRGFVEELQSVGSTSGRNVQIIVPGYTFTCHGLITNWLIVVRKADQVAPQPIELQVWRPTGDNNFALIGSNMLPLAENEPEAFLLNYSIPLNSQIQVAPGDVVGAYYPLNPAYRIRSVPSQNDSAPEVYIVNSASPTCTFKICDTILVQKNRVPQLQVITVTPPDDVNQILPSCVPWPKRLCPAPEVVSLSSVLQPTAVLHGTPVMITASPSPTTFTTTTTTATAPTIIGESSISTATVASSMVVNVVVTSNPQEPNQQSSSSTISSEGIIYSLIASVIVLALSIVMLAVFLTLRFHRRYQHSKKSPENDARERSGSCDSSIALQLPDTPTQSSTDDLPDPSTTANSEHPYTPLYWEPASERNALYYQLKKRLYLDIVGGTIEIGEEIGGGQFGRIYKGRWQSGQTITEVAIKVPSETYDAENEIKLLQEATIMGQFQHPNVLTLYGVVTQGNPVMIVLELMRKGDLKSYLSRLSYRPPSTPHEVTQLMDLKALLTDFSYQIAAGMSYLSAKGFVHRDLAARNILVTENDICKISDFGMARDIADTNYYIMSSGKIPVKWTAPEALALRKYSTASDVWSYGVVLYETWSLGKHPYEDMYNEEVLDNILSGYRMSPPEMCPCIVYQTMLHCWHPIPRQRPTFVRIMDIIAEHRSEVISETNQSDFNGQPIAEDWRNHVQECVENLYMEMQDDETLHHSEV